MKTKLEHSLLSKPSEHSLDERSKLAGAKCIPGSTISACMCGWAAEMCLPGSTGQHL